MLKTESAVQSHVKSDDALAQYIMYDFELLLLGSKDSVKYSCPARHADEAWVLAAMKVNRFNMPCVSIILKGTRR